MRRVLIVRSGRFGTINFGGPTDAAKISTENVLEKKVTKPRILAVQATQAYDISRAPGTRWNLFRPHSRRITVIPDVCNGKPTVRGLRITVATVLGYLAAGESIEEILDVQFRRRH